MLQSEPLEYVSAREKTRSKVLGSLGNDRESLDDVLKQVHDGRQRRTYGADDGRDRDGIRLHRVAVMKDLPYKRRIVDSSDLPPVY